MVSVLDSHASDPGSNLTSSTNCLFFTEIFKKLALLPRPILKSFLKFPCQELSEYVVGSSPFHKIRLGRTVSSKVRMSWQEESVYELWWVMKFLETNAINLSQNEIRNDSCKIPIARARARVAFAWRQKIFSLIEKKIYYSILIWHEFFVFEPRISKGEVLPKYKFFFHIRLYYSK